MVLCNATPAQDEQPKKKPNAAPLYLKAIEEMQSSLTDPDTKRMSWPRDNEDLTTGEWRDAVAKSAVACTLFTAATQVAGCAFPPIGDGEKTGLRSKILRLVDLRTLVTARGMQQATKDPRGACTTALQLLQYGRHCSLDPTLMGLALSHDAEESATLILAKALPKLRLEKDAREVARRFLKKLDEYVASRPSRSDLAKTAVSEFNWVLETNFSDEAKKNPMILAARQRAGAIVAEMVQPLHEKKPTPDKAFRKQYDARIAKLKKVMGKRSAKAVLEHGKGETLASVLVLLAGTSVPRFVETHTEQTQRLAASRKLLTEFLDSAPDAAKKKTARKDNAVVLYELAITEARRAFDVPDGQMLDLPHEAAMASYRDEFWRKCTKSSAIARSLFEQASQLRHCRFEGLGSRRSQLDELGPVLIQLRTLVYAHAVQNIKQRPGVALCDASCLLDHARQLSGVDSLQALALANVAEDAALQIARTVQDAPAAMSHGDDLKRFAAKLDKHRKQRGTLRHLAAVVHDEVMNELPRFCKIDETNPYRVILAARVRKALEPVTNFAAHPKGSIATLETTKAELKQEVRKNKLKTLKGNKQADLCVDRLLLPKVAHLAILLRKRNELTELIEELR